MNGITRKCLVCGREFTTNRNTKKFCSKACCDEHFRRVAREKYRTKHGIGITLTPLKCPVCGQEFLPARPTQIYCSILCRSKKWYGNVKVKECTCENCGKKFMDVYNTKFCSRRCRRIMIEKTKLSTPVEKNAELSLAEWARQAALCNLDYGTYRALITAGKTFEELYDLKDSTSTFAHARGRKSYRDRMQKVY